MGFLTPMLLAGSVLVAVPIVLHLIMRRQPQQFVFPALRFVQARRQSNQRRMRLRHLLLLALRCALIAGFAFALARPTLQGSGLRGKEGAPLAVSLVIDNSLRMQYIEGNQTRLELAVEMATWLVGKLPEESSVAVLDRGRSLGGFVVDARTAKSRLTSLVSTSHPRPLEDMVCEAIELVAQREDCRQEVFLFSDMSTASLTKTGLQQIAEALAEAAEVRIYLVDVGAENPQNVSLGQLQMSSGVPAPGESLRVELEVQSLGSTAETLAELFVKDAVEGMVKRGQQLVNLIEDDRGDKAPARVTFELAKLPLGTFQGYVQLGDSDPLPVDNTRYFTIEVHPAAKVLLVGETLEESLFIREALSPSQRVEHASTRFHCDSIQFDQLSTAPLDDYRAIGLFDPPQLSDAVWNQLADHADAGGGIGIFLGHNASPPQALNEGAAQRLLPGKLRRRSRDTTYFRPTQLDHPALKGLRDYAEDIPWQIYQVLQFWEFSDLADNTHIIARFANGQPALLGRSVTRGRVLTMATPFSDPLQPIGREPWNLLPTGPEPWPFVALSNQLFGFLTRDTDTRTNFLAGETVDIRLAPRQQLSSFVIHQPNGEAIRQALPPGQESILLSTAEALGNYQLAAGGESRKLDRGFSINCHEEVSQLQRVSVKTITDALPADRVRVARNLDDIERYVDIGRSGHELFSWIIMFVAAVWGAEHLLSNRFYSTLTP